jgi:hypothetical protein
MPFDYYESLNASQKATYRKSDRVTGFKLQRTPELAQAVESVRASLATERTRDVNVAVNRLCGLLARQMRFTPVAVKVLAKRPRSRGEELHGIYEREEGRQAHIQVWMRTARHRRVVTFRTFLRTLLHELCHHIDYELLRLEDTFHTEGFFKRESSLMRILAPPEPKKKPKQKPKAKPKPRTKKKPTAKAKPKAKARPAAAKKASAPVQLSLFDDWEKR